MKKPLLPCVLLVLLLLGACGKTVVPDVSLSPTGLSGAPTEAVSVPSPDVSAVLSEADALKKAESSGAVVTRALSGAGLQSALNGKRNDVVKFESSAAEDAVVDAGDYSASTVLVNAPKTKLTVNAALGALRLDALDGSCTLNAKVGMLSVYGEDITVTMSGGADTVYVQGKNCTLRLTGGAYGVIYSVNATVKVENQTDATVFVTMGSGVTHAVAPGETLSF